ncbi:MAG TPA: malate dehydrogenase [Candidatus Nanoarchaeia archaeon]|nr:malate dehydrogenase [Candidatus Nanoarchaeia archaeon]
MRSKISIIGAGMVGAQTASLIAQRNLGDVVLIDIEADMAKGKALDILQSLPIVDSPVSVSGGGDYALTKNSDIIVVVAGIPRKPGMTREQLVETNAKIVGDVTRKAAPLSKHAILIVVTNPLDVMAYVAKKASGFPKERVIGMAGILDSSRFRAFIAQEAHVHPKDVSVLVLGSHGEEMVPLERFALINNKPAVDVLGKKLHDIVERTKNAGAEIVSLLKTGSAYYAPAAAITEMVESILKDQKKTLPCSVYLDGEYGVKDVYIGVPVVLGKHGVEKIIDVKLTADEKKRFDGAVKSIQGMIAHINV